MLLNYHIGRIVLGSLCVGDLVRHQISNTQRTENKTTNVVIQQHSRKLLMMDILLSETCWVHKKWNKIVTSSWYFTLQTSVYCSLWKTIPAVLHKASVQNLRCYFQPMSRHRIFLVRCASNTEVFWTQANLTCLEILKKNRESFIQFVIWNIP